MTKGKDGTKGASGENMPSGEGRVRRGRLRPPSAFDQWLTRGLHELFDDVAKEPIPEDLLKLIEDDKS